MTASSRKSSTSTARFGSSRREGHDASAFYERFTPPTVSTTDRPTPPSEIDKIFVADARGIGEHVPDNSVALVVTSPPYFAGKEYEETLGQNGVPATYFEYLKLLTDVFAACVDALEPGGRIAVNVANLGRRPYRSLSADVTGILQDLGLLMRGEVVWWKGRAAGGSCAWGTFQRPTNPVLRDVTERILIASKGRFDRALTPKQRHDEELPSTATISRDEFLEATTDLWEMAPASATRVGHPAPFPVELPKRLIELYTYKGDVVLDPFMGAGTTALASLRTGRHYLGFDTDAGYVGRAEDRIKTERERLNAEAGNAEQFQVELQAVKTPEPENDDDYQARAVREGRQAKYLARQLIEQAGFVNIEEGRKHKALGVEVNFIATDQTGDEWVFDVSGAFTANRSGLKRTDTLWKALGKAAVLYHGGEVPKVPLVLLTTDAPTPGSAGDKALRQVRGPDKPVFDLIELLNVDDQNRLHKYAMRGRD